MATAPEITSPEQLRDRTKAFANRIIRLFRALPSKLGVVVEEADETIYWLELLGENGIMPQRGLAELLKEAHELTAIFTAARETSRAK